MQLEQERPRQADAALRRRQGAADHIVDVPDGEAGDREDNSPLGSFPDFVPDSPVGHPCAD